MVRVEASSIALYLLPQPFLFAAESSQRCKDLKLLMDFEAARANSTQDSCSKVTSVASLGSRVWDCCKVSRGWPQRPCPKSAREQMGRMALQVAAAVYPRGICGTGIQAGIGAVAHRRGSCISHPHGICGTEIQSLELQTQSTKWWADEAICWAPGWDQCRGNRQPARQLLFYYVLQNQEGQLPSLLPWSNLQPSPCKVLITDVFISCFLGMYLIPVWAIVPISCMGYCTYVLSEIM